MLHRWLGRACVVAVLIAACLAVTGCGGGKVNKENKDKIKTGMTESEVEAVLGKPTTSEDKEIEMMGVKAKVKVATWKDGDKHITVTYDKDNKVQTVTATGL